MQQGQPTSSVLAIGLRLVDSGLMHFLQKKKKNLGKAKLQTSLEFLVMENWGIFTSSEFLLRIQLCLKVQQVWLSEDV